MVHPRDRNVFEDHLNREENVHDIKKKDTKLHMQYDAGFVNNISGHRKLKILNRDVIYFLW